MDENPCESPKSVPKGEEPPAKPPNRYELAIRNALMAFFGFVMLQMVILDSLMQSGLVEFDIHPVPVLQRKLLGICALIALPVAAAVAFWTWRKPRL